MASEIDVTVPVFGNPTTESVRDNFAIAKDEIEELQDLADHLALNALMKTGGTMTGPLVLAGEPDAPLEAATKKYVDDRVADFTGIDGGTF
jgi:hypothetical protein